MSKSSYFIKKNFVGIATDNAVGIATDNAQTFKKVMTQTLKVPIKDNCRLSTVELVACVFFKWGKLLLLS